MVFACTFTTIIIATSAVHLMVPVTGPGKPRHPTCFASRPNGKDNKKHVAGTRDPTWYTQPGGVDAAAVAKGGSSFLKKCKCSSGSEQGGALLASHALPEMAARNADVDPRALGKPGLFDGAGEAWMRWSFTMRA